MGLVRQMPRVDNPERRGNYWGYAVEGHPVNESVNSAVPVDGTGYLLDRTLFFAEVEHKVRTALAVLQGWAVTLDERWDVLDDAGRRDAVSVIRRTADKVVGQCEQLLEDARLERSVDDVEPEVIDLTAAVRGEGRLDEVGQTVVFDGEGPVPARAVPSALQQIVGHLVDNAKKYSPEGAPVILRTKEEDGWAVLQVEDQGIGIPEGMEHDIFQPFLRLSPADTSGVGLGLFIVRKLAVAMGGSVCVERNGTGGSTFTVRLPVGEVAPA